MALSQPPETRLPPAVTALDGYPWLRTAVATSLEQQIAQIQERETVFTGRRSVLAALHEQLRAIGSGLVTLEGPAGSGVTSILAHLAMTRPWGFWFADQDARQGAAALHAQLIALHHTSVPLVVPTAGSDTAAMERLFDEIAARHSSDDPFVLIVDAPASPTQPHSPLPMPLPGSLPPHMIILYGCGPDTALPLPATARMTLPRVINDELIQDQTRILRGLGCPEEWITPLIAAARGNFLYLRLACSLLQQQQLSVGSLPAGLEALYAAWWARLDPNEQRLALILAAADEAVPVALCRDILGTDPQPLQHNNAAWIVVRSELETRIGDSASESAVELIEVPHLSLTHPATRDYLARHHGPALAAVHAEIAALALPPGRDQLDPNHADHYTSRYLLRQTARHAALGTPHTRTMILPLVTQRTWISAHERSSGQMADAARDLAWELHCAAETDSLLRLTRSTWLAGSLATLARRLTPDAATAALAIAIEQEGRETGLKRILALVELLPDGPDKAQILRQLGEACYGARMRASAMRLLSQALDLEEQRTPRVWREQRDQLQVELCAASLTAGNMTAALTIAARIDHRERRGMAETQIVRWLLARYEPALAQEVASAITHESLGAWAQAEVAVALARAGQPAEGEALLADIAVETATAWAQIELACDEAIRDEDAARARINQLRSANQRDRGLTRLAHALALADKDGDALEVAGQISDVATRVSALLDLRLTLEGLVAMLALEQATSAIDALHDDARVPLVATLAAAHAALGRRERAINIACQLTAGEERDRALSRVAVSLARYGEHAQGQALAYELSDDDERDWTLDELTRILAGAGRWQEARELGERVHADELRARTLAELAITRAREEDSLVALQMALSISIPAERLRALTMMVPALIRAGHVTRVLELAAAAPGSPTSPFLHVTERRRYLVAVATALAQQGSLDLAERIARSIAHPMERARIHLAVALAAAPHDQAWARKALGTALQTATLGRVEAFRLLEQAAPLLAHLDGAELLTRIAADLDETDTW